MLNFGGDYNPEQWPEEVWAEDIALMRQAGVNLVSLGVFSWARLEPREGHFRFDWLDRAMDLLHAGGVRVALATPTASPPPWFSLAHPDAMPVNSDGLRLTHGSRDTYCVSAPAYREVSLRIATALGERYGGHPALAMWHVHNEYGTWCGCDHTAEAFRGWLRRRHGTLAALGEAWTTSFWGQSYGDWAEIEPPRATQYLPNPSQIVDFRRFLAGEMLGHFTAQRDVLRGFTLTVPITTNFAFGSWVPVDGWRWAPELDLVAIDCYPSATGATGNEQVAFAADLARSLAGEKPWLLMEQAADMVYTDGRMRSRPAGELARHTLAHVARGSVGAMHFQWRASPGGAEMWHAAMLPHAGAESRVFREVCALGATLARLSDVEGRVHEEVAIVWDPESWWALQVAGLPARPGLHDRDNDGDLDYLDAVARVHAALYRRNVPVDFVAATGDLTRYRLVLAPGLYLVGAEAERNLNGYTGALVVWYFGGVVDEHVRVRLGGHPGAFRDRLGVRVEEFSPQPPDVRLPLSSGDTASGWRETVRLQGARVEAAYADGSPAITRHGDSWYVSTRLDDAGLARFLDGVLAEIGIAVPEAPAGVEIVRRGEWLFVLNHGDQTAADQTAGEQGVDVLADGVDAFTGIDVAGSVHVAAGGFRVVRSP